MLDLIAPALAPEQGERLTRSAYKQEFREREDAIRDGSSWKLERRQHFEEQGNPSRDALRRGYWDEACGCSPTVATRWPRLLGKTRAGDTPFIACGWSRSR